MNKAMVIVGAGETGARAAAELRDRGWEGRIILIGKESESPYERPPLSKYAMVQADVPEPAYILNERAITDLKIELITGTGAMTIDRDEHAVVLEDGRRFAYERLLLATGAKPRRLTISGSEPEGILYLRTFADALAIRSRLRPGSHVIIIGAGFIGLELAASARERGCGVTVLEAGYRILMRGVPAEIAAAIHERHLEAGVRFELGVGIAAIDTAGDGHRIRLADGRTLICDVLIAGIGAVPDTSLAESCGLAVDNGIRVDAALATSDPDIFAAGDCCSFPHPLYGDRRIRLEAWRNAQDQGTHVAGAMLGNTGPYRTVPWFWSDQYDLTLQVSGLPDTGITTVARKAITGDNWLFFHLDGDGRLVSASGIGGPSLAKDIKVAEMMIERRLKPDPSLLARPDLKLKTLLQEIFEDKGA